jgi:alpha-beta hydrolase superfamily lysophospholipase
MKYKKLFRRLGWAVLTVFILLNIVACFHAYKFTHFSNDPGTKTKAGDLAFGEKIKALIFGINNPRPFNKSIPTRDFETIIIQSNKKLECWLIKADSSRGSVILFHGYGGEKSSMLDKADEFLKLGYSTLLVDFMGAGGSEGNQTTIGFREAEEVKSCYAYLLSKGEKKIYLFGTSLGAAAILKSIHDYAIHPAGIMIECPFGSLYQTTAGRFKSLNIPSFPLAGLLVFWGGVQNGFRGFSFKPVEYAKSVKCPALLLYGEKDERVSREETDAIFSNLKGSKKLMTFPLAGHENYLIKYRTEWTEEINRFLLSTENKDQ